MGILGKSSCFEVIILVKFVTMSINIIRLTHVKHYLARVHMSSSKVMSYTCKGESWDVSNTPSISLQGFVPLNLCAPLSPLHLHEHCHNQGVPNPTPHLYASIQDTPWCLGINVPPLKFQMILLQCMTQSQASKQYPCGHHEEFPNLFEDPQKSKE